MRGAQRLFPWILVTLGLDSPQYIPLTFRAKPANKAGHNFFIQTQTFRGHLQLAELIDKLKSRHPLTTRRSPLPVDETGRRLGAQFETLVGEWVHPIRQAGFDFFNVLLNRLGETEIPVEVFLEHAG